MTDPRQLSLFNDEFEQDPPPAEPPPSVDTMALTVSVDFTQHTVFDNLPYGSPTQQYVDWLDQAYATVREQIINQERIV